MRTTDSLHSLFMMLKWIRTGLGKEYEGSLVLVKAKKIS